MLRVAVIGGGAAGFFSAIHVKMNHPDASVTLYEKSKKLLSKVKVSGGGRCNVTNGCSDVNELIKAYPRGGRKLKKSFHRFNTSDTMEWFESRGVPLMIQEDQCVFPVSQDSQSIIDCFLMSARKLGIEIVTSFGVESISKTDEELWKLSFKSGESEDYDKVIIATGGSPKRSGLEWLEKLGHRIEDPVPSLFTFNMPDETIPSLMGIVVEEAWVSIQGTKLVSDGPLLITHWGMSGPAILKLSAFGARILEEKDYTFKIQVNWVNEKNNEKVKGEILKLIDEHQKKLLSNIRPFYIPERLWHFLLEKNGFKSEARWADLGKKSINRLVNILTHDIYEVRGKTTFKEEFVTCGGVSLSEIDLNTMESRKAKGIYFAGEVMDIDAITGGYNFQAAWTTGFIAGQLGE